MGTFATIAATVIGAGVGISQARGQRNEGKVQEAEFKRAAEQEKIAATDRERERRNRLNQILGTNIAQTGARGIAFEGSPTAVAGQTIEQASLEQQGAKISDLTRISQLKRAGKGAIRTAKNRSTATLLNTASSTLLGGAKIAQSLPSKKTGTT